MSFFLFRNKETVETRLAKTDLKSLLRAIW